MRNTSPAQSTCAIARTLAALNDRWSFLVLREAFSGVTKFGEFRENLGIASDVLSARLATLVDYGILTKERYQEPGQRARDAYLLTPAGTDLKVVLGALQQWGDNHLARPEGPSIHRVDATTGAPLNVVFADDQGHVVDKDEAAFVRTAAYPSGD
ncbi:winged helix-turn-helix transcriptional regulator [Labedaea rhizosphaerae]|uniref:HxlR family transcriptional regulator n=1 Tax=Labedaea rhizosphaerae TaxID=598644 RepID=A0A4V3CZL6_LABRH|nr:helix-turn-helix domain-containing protein [Labedaea rhizosphaerae]TDQ00231.1 HxlR family transcriptional regulator [Labedaea rhizosphaerae]